MDCVGVGCLHDACVCGWGFQSLWIAVGEEKRWDMWGRVAWESWDWLCGLGIVERWPVRLVAGESLKRTSETRSDD